LVSVSPPCSAFVQSVHARCRSRGVCSFRVHYILPSLRPVHSPIVIVAVDDRFQPYL
jgi:hypothetical protein